MPVGDALERMLSRPTAKPYRSGKVKDEQVHLNHNGYIDFSSNDIENPKNWSTARRWYITIVTVSLVLNATFASSSPTGAIESLSTDLGVSMEAATLVTTLFLLGYCAGPLFWAPLSEYYGRRYIFYLSFLAYFAFNFLCAFTPDFAGLLVGRFFTGTFASASLSNVPGVLADLWGPIERGNAMVTFSMITFAGPALGPVISGFLQVTKDWRWSFYVLIWLSVISLALMFTVLTNKARRVRAAKLPGYETVQSPVEAEGQTLANIFKVALSRPWAILLDPIALLIAIYMSIVYALLYMLFTIYPIVFQGQRHWNAGVGELPLIGLMVGAVIAGAIVFYESTLGKKKMLAGIERSPEDRMPLAMIGGVAFPITMFWFAWTANFDSIHWIVPTLAGTFLSAAIVLIFVSYLNYITDTYLKYAASALAGNTVMRSALGAVAPLWTNQMFDALGVAGAGSLIAGVACLLAPIPFLFYRYGKTIRQKSKFAPTDEAMQRPTEQQPQQGNAECRDGETHESGSEESRKEEEEELALDEEAGVLNRDLEKQLSRDQDQDHRYLDANRMEKAET